MNARQALAEARRWWGKNGMVEDCRKPALNSRGEVLHGRFMVGYAARGFFNVQGSGETWERAFSNARV